MNIKTHASCTDMDQLSNIKKILSTVGTGDILIVVPPFVNARTPIMGPHILQAIAREQGYSTDILYVNLLLSSIIGNKLYESISYGQPFRMLGERLFARSAHGLPPLGISPDLCLNPGQAVFGDTGQSSIKDFEYKYLNLTDFNLDSFFKIEEICTSLIEKTAETITSLKYKIVGCSTNWEQNNCCIALLNMLKKAQPDLLTLIGGSNCEDKMAEGIASLSKSVDYIFSGESEQTFSDFLKRYSKGNLPSQRIITGEPVEEMDNIPLPDYEAYFEQIEAFFSDNHPPEEITIAYETSRGCWWGKCSFCGQNGRRMRFRQKAVEKVVEDLEEIRVSYPENRVLIIDKVMPPSYQEKLLPLLFEKEDASQFSCEHRPTIELQELIRLKRSNFNVIKFGIEALSTGLLKLMNKGVTAAQNILLLRNAGLLGMFVDWNMLWGFPGDRAFYYEETLKLLPLIHHLNPPAVFRHLCLDRFCKYFEKPEDYEIRNVRPWAVYKMIYPDWADLGNLAYRFIGDYPCGAHENLEIIDEIDKEIKIWKSSWKNSTLIMRAFGDYFTIYDSRKIVGKTKNHIMDAFQAREIMTYDTYNNTEYQNWAIEEKLGVVVDSLYVPLVLTSTELLSELEENTHNS